MKILTLNHEFPPVGGGAAPVALELCRNLVQQGHHVDVVTMHYKDLPRYEMVDGIHVYRTPALRKQPNICHTHEMITYAPGAIGRVLKLVRQQRHDIIHCHFLIPGGPLALMVSKLTGVPYVVTAHGSDIPGYNPDRFQFQHKLTKPILKSVCKHAQAVTSPSFYLKRLMQANIGPYPIDHIPNGIDVEGLGWDLTRPKENIILATGRLLKRKGFQTLIKAVHDCDLPFEVHIAGDGPYREELERLAQGSQTKVVFHGWLDPDSQALKDLYERASIFSLVSSNENASISLLEGMAARCVVITSNVSGCPETVGDAGFLIEFEDVEALTQILQDLASNPTKLDEYGQRAAQRVADKFLWPDISKMYVDAYHNEVAP